MSRRSTGLLSSAGGTQQELPLAAEAILRAAEAIFAERGFTAATTREIAARAGLNKGLIFYYFGDKQKLFAAVVDSFFLHLRRRIRDFLARGGNELAVLRQAVDFAVDFTAEHVSLLVIVQREIIDRGPYHRTLLRRHFMPIIKMGIDFIERGVRSGKFRRVDPVRFIYTLLGVNIFYFTAGPVLEGWLGRPSPTSRKALDEQKKELWGFIRRGLEVEKNIQGDY